MEKSSWDEVETLDIDSNSFTIFSISFILQVDFIENRALFKHLELAKIYFMASFSLDRPTYPVHSKISRWFEQQLGTELGSFHDSEKSSSSRINGCEPTPKGPINK